MSKEGSEEHTSPSKSEKVESSVHIKSQGNSVLVSPRQRGNPLLTFITHVPWEFDDRTLADYVMGQTTCALYLSMKYHNLNPDYIHERLKILGKNYCLRVLLVMVWLYRCKDCEKTATVIEKKRVLSKVDIKEPQHVLKNLTRIAILADLTLMLCRSSEEAGKMIERYKMFQYKPADAIMEKKEADPYMRLIAALTAVRSVNKTDAAILLATFKTLEGILKASETSLSLCPGIGPQKASQLHKILHQPFLKNDSYICPTKKKKLNQSCDAYISLPNQTFYI